MAACAFFQTSPAFLRCCSLAARRSTQFLTIQLMFLLIGSSRFLFIFLRHWIPGFVWVEAIHALEFGKGSGAEVLLVDNTVLADHEGLHSSDSILRRRGNKSKSADHRAFHDIIHLAQRCCRPLPLENLEEITVVGLYTIRVALLNSLRNFLADRATPTAIGILPR